MIVPTRLMCVVKYGTHNTNYVVAATTEQLPNWQQWRYIWLFQTECIRDKCHRDQFLKRFLHWCANLGDTWNKKSDSLGRSVYFSVYGTLWYPGNKCKIELKSYQLELSNTQLQVYENKQKKNGELCAYGRCGGNSGARFKRNISFVFLHDSSTFD